METSSRFLRSSSSFFSAAILARTAARYSSSLAFFSASRLAFSSAAARAFSSRSARAASSFSRFSFSAASRFACTAEMQYAQRPATSRVRTVHGMHTGSAVGAV